MDSGGVIHHNLHIRIMTMQSAAQSDKRDTLPLDRIPFCLVYVCMNPSNRRAKKNLMEVLVLGRSYHYESGHVGGSRGLLVHYSDVIKSTMTSHITSLTIVYSTVYSGAD